MIEWAAGRGFLQAGGKRLEWACWGVSSDRPVIVLLHEGLGCVALWRDFPQALAEATGCGVFAYSRAGYGRSDGCDLPRPLDYMTCEAVEVLPEVLTALASENVVLMGHSDGTWKRFWTRWTLLCWSFRDARTSTAHWRRLTR